MTGTAGRARIAEAIRVAVEDRGQRAMGLMLGHAGTTIGRWGADLSSWPAAALIDLAHKDAEVRAAVVESLTIEQAPAAPAAVVRDAGQTLRDCAATLAQVSADLADGNISRDEAARELPGIRATLRSLRILEGDLTAMLKGAR